MASLLTALVAVCTSQVVFAQEKSISYVTSNVQPLFKAHCTRCHGPKQQKNGVRLERRRDAFCGGTANQTAIGNSETSHLYFRLVGDRYGLKMPPDGPLTPDMLNVIKARIDQGAEWPDEASGERPFHRPIKATRHMNLRREGDR